MVLEDKEKKILEFIQGDIPLVANPFQELAKSLDISEAEVIAKIKKWQDSGVIRRFGAVLRHQKAGYNTNAMVAWLVNDKMTDEIGEIMAEHPRVSHCYLREVPQDFRYNLFTMIHATSQDDLAKIIAHLSKVTNVKEYNILQSVKELKKTSLKYV